MRRKFTFDLFRLNIVDIDDLFYSDISLRLRGDFQLLEVIEQSCLSNADLEQTTKNAKFKWSLRHYNNYQDYFENRKFVSVVLARSILEKDGLIVTEEGISSGSSSSYPPLASTIVIFFDIKRHLVAVEHSGELVQTAWKDFIEQILERTSRALNKTSRIELEPVPEKHEIISLFKSFDKVTRIKATLRIPNPELTRYTESLFEDLKNSDVREYTQDMKNPSGLSKSESARPFATAILAQQGYKKGDVYFEGFRNDTFEKVTSGATASKGSIKSLKDFVRGMNVNARSKETKNVLQEIANEIDKIHPVEVFLEDES